MKKEQQIKKVLIFGTFDGIHPGHLFFLSEARKLGLLNISLASDESVKLRKNRYPKNNALLRKVSLEKLKIADKVIIGDKKPGDWSPIKKINPDMIVLGYDQTHLKEALKTINKKYKFKILTMKEFKGDKFHSSILNKEKSCPYCTIPEIKARTILENKHAWAFPTNIPIVPGHILISPKRCVAKFEDMTKIEIEAVFNLFHKLKTALEKTFKADGFNMAWNEGVLAGQSVPHFHLHVLPRKDGDTGILKYEPRKFIYRPGSREASEEKELQKIVKLIKNNL